MKYLFIYLFLLITSVSAEYKMDNYKLSEMGKIPKDSLVYPVSQFIKAMKSGKVEDCLRYVSEQVLYDKDTYGDNFFLRIKRVVIKTPFSIEGKIEFNLYKKENFYEVVTLIDGKNNTEIFINFRIKKFNGKYRIFKIGSSI